MSTAFTLGVKGKLRAPNGDSALQSALDHFIPYEYIVQWFREREGRTGIQNRLLVIQSGTASGKSMTIPAELFSAFIRGKVAGGGIICTQPRILTAIDNARQMSSIPKYKPILKLGETIGWSTQFSKHKPRRIGLLSATLGILAAQLQLFTDVEISSLYRFMIIDEAHERPLAADMTLASLKGFLLRNSQSAQCPFVVLMSATIDVFKYARYFLGSRDDSSLIDNIIICDAAPSFERRIIFPERPIANIIEEATRIIKEIIEKNPANPLTWDSRIAIPEGKTAPRESDDILVFLPGAAEMTPMYDALDDFNYERRKSGAPMVYVARLNRQTIIDETQEYRNLDIALRDINEMHKDYLCERRVIISTNVAETGKTFATLRYVIDAGYSRENEYNPNVKVEVLLSKPAALSRIEQRWGRVARRFPGVAYPLYTKEIMARLPRQQFPDIIISNISPIILSIIFEQQKIKYLYDRSATRHPYFRIDDIDMIDKPKADTLIDGLERAYALGFIARDPPVFSTDIEEFLAAELHAGPEFLGITKMGRIAIEMQETISSLDDIRMVLAGFAHSYRASELVAIALSNTLQPEADEAPETKDAKVKRKELRLDLIYQTAFSTDHHVIVDASRDSREIAIDGESGMILTTWRTILGDTFFDGAVIHAALMNVLESAKKTENPLRILIGWCRQIGASTKSAIQFIEQYEAACGALISLGFDVNKGTSIIQIMRDSLAQSTQPNPTELSSAIVHYKRCLYDGFRLNTVYWNEERRHYETSTGLRIQPGFIEKKFIFAPDAVPKVLILNKFSSIANRETTTYDIVGHSISILDGFIGDDILFTQ